jgi:hypothetical protein
MQFAAFRKKRGFYWVGVYSGSRWERNFPCRVPSRCQPCRPGYPNFASGDEDGIYRAFYYTAAPQGILVFHAFVKKTQRTPPLEIELGRKRLKELLDA